jgi:hypothetical protein
MSPEPFLPFEIHIPYLEDPVDLDAETDFLPEFCHYQDEGCELSPSCLECPFSACVEDGKVGPAAITRSLRDAAIVKMYSEKHISAAKLARRFHIVPRTIFRILLAAQDQPGRFSVNLVNLIIFAISSFLFIIPAVVDNLPDFLGF